MLTNITKLLQGNEYEREKFRTQELYRRQHHGQSFAHNRGVRLRMNPTKRMRAKSLTRVISDPPATAPTVAPTVVWGPPAIASPTAFKGAGAPGALQLTT